MWLVAVPRESALLGCIAALLGASGLGVVLAKEAARARQGRAQRASFLVGVVMLVVLVMTAFDASVVAFNTRVFGAEVLGTPVTWVAALATAILLGPPVMIGVSSLAALQLAARGHAAGRPAPTSRGVAFDALFGRVRILLWMTGLAAAPEAARGELERARAAGAWFIAVVGGWIGYTVWRGI